MKIKAVVDRIEDGYAILTSDDYGIEISIPADTSGKEYLKGENVTLMLDGDENEQ